MRFWSEKDGKDFIWIGTGLGFKMKPGQAADETKIEKVFVLHKNKASERFDINGINPGKVRFL